MLPKLGIGLVILMSIIWASSALLHRPVPPVSDQHAEMVVELKRVAGESYTPSPVVPITVRHRGPIQPPAAGNAIGARPPSNSEVSYDPPLHETILPQ